MFPKSKWTVIQNSFGDRLVSEFMFDSDHSDNPHLPSPLQLKNKILIKNKKLVAEPTQMTTQDNRVSKLLFTSCSQIALNVEVNVENGTNISLIISVMTLFF